MADEDDTRAAGGQAPDHFEEAFRLLRGEGRGRFVEQEDSALGEEGLGYLHQLLLSYGEFAYRALWVEVDA